MTKIAAIILAAGLSRRYGVENKLLSMVQGKPMLLGVVETVAASSIDRIVVVTGHESDQIKQVLHGIPKVVFAFNRDFKLGMSTSIVRGIQELDQIDFCLICLGDLPYLVTSDYDDLVKHIKTNPSTRRIIIPVFQAERGHPVIFGRDFFNELMSIPVSDQGARVVLLNNSDYLEEIEVGHDRILKDVDFNTPD